MDTATSARHASRWLVYHRSLSLEYTGSLSGFRWLAPSSAAWSGSTACRQILLDYETSPTAVLNNSIQLSCQSQTALVVKFNQKKKEKKRRKKTAGRKDPSAHFGPSIDLRLLIYSKDRKRRYAMLQLCNLPVLRSCDMPPRRY